MPAKKKETTLKTLKVKSTPKKKAPVKKSSVTAKQRFVAFFSWEQWKQTFTLATSSWKHIIGRYTLVLLLALAFQFLGVMLLSFGLIAIVGGPKGIENFVANLQIGTWPEIRTIFSITGAILVWFAYLVVVTGISKVAFLLVIKDFVTGKKRPVITLFFKEGFRFLGRYIGLALVTSFYILWPMLVFSSLFLAWDLILYSNDSLSLNVPILDTITPVLFVGLLLASSAYAIYASVKVLFAIPTLIQSDKSVMKSFKLTKQITKGAWLFTALMWLLFVVLLYAVNIILSMVAYYDPIVIIDAVNPADMVRLTDLLAFCLSLFIFGPITTAFQYFLMLQTAKNQLVKL